MARTKASVGAKVSSRKSSKAQCVAAPPTSSSSSSGECSSRNSYSGGNPWCQREIPEWQKPITNFFATINTVKECTENVETSPNASNSKQKSSKRNVIESDEEGIDLQTETTAPLEVEETSLEKPKNQVLDETIDLEPLTGENSHKMDEYYPTNNSCARTSHEYPSTSRAYPGHSRNHPGSSHEYAGSSREYASRFHRYAGSSHSCDDKENLDVNNSMNISGDNNNNNDDCQTVNMKPYKGKGIGKKSNKNKTIAETRKPLKRDLEQVIFGEEPEHVTKKAKP